MNLKKRMIVLFLWFRSFYSNFLCDI